jgi:hypothetical protein
MNNGGYKMVKVYKTFMEASSDLPNARLELSHGGEQEVFVEHHTLGYVIAEFKVINGEHVFQRYYKGE